MRFFAIFIALLLVVCANAQTAPWPVERQNRWGSGFAVSGPDPSTLTTPWISDRLGAGLGPVSGGPVLGDSGIGYFGNWSNNRLFKFDYNTGAILSNFLT